MVNGETALSRWQLFWRYALAVSYLVFSAVVVVAEWDNSSWWRDLPGLLMGVLGLGLIRFRRQRPLLVLVIISLMLAVSPACAVVANWALISLATRRRWNEIVPGAAIYLVGMSVQLLTQDTRDNPTGRMTFVSLLATVVVMVSIGMFLGARRDLVGALHERARTAEREQQLRVLQGQATERNRIAREMHDVLAHRMSLVSMHAGILAFREDLTPEETRDIARVIQENSHASLTELRSVLGSLREDQVVPAEQQKPQPERLDVDGLVAEARAAGASIDYENTLVDADRVPALTARHGYRIVQEALTNARKHAPGEVLRLRVNGAPGQGVSLVASNPIPRADAVSGVPGSSLGLVGVRERVDLAGGRMSVRREADTFELEVWLPW